MEEKLKQRIKLLQSSDLDYTFPKRFSKADYIITAIVIFVCLAFVIAGGFL